MIGTGNFQSKAFALLFCFSALKIIRVGEGAPEKCSEYQRNPTLSNP